MPGFTVDIEVTNRCNASCHFCPRDMTPHQGLMGPETFARALERAVEYRELVRGVLDVEASNVGLCGLGEPLLNKHTATYAAQVRDAGFSCELSTNAALLSADKAEALLAAGIKSAYINVGEIDDEYEAVYKLPFAKTRDNILRFAEMAGDACEIYIVLVDHRRDAEHIARMKAYWSAHGLDTFQEFEIMNRGGALFVDHMQFAGLPQAAEADALLADRGVVPLCGAPFGYLFVGYDGQYYLCCSDWTKQVPLGSVFDLSFGDVIRPKLEHVASREPVCKTCNLDPFNQVTDELRAQAVGETVLRPPSELADEIVLMSAAIRQKLEEIRPGVTEGLEAVRGRSGGRRLIPVTGS